MVLYDSSGHVGLQVWEYDAECTQNLGLLSLLLIFSFVVRTQYNDSELV